MSGNGEEHLDDYSPLYWTLGICAVVLAFTIIFNIFFYCCSKHRKYWRDRNTGNQWV